MRRTIKTVTFAAAAAAATCLTPGQALTQEGDAQNAQPGNYYNQSYPGVYYEQGWRPRWTFVYGTWRCTPGYSYYRPLQPSDWSNGPHGPRHNLNASQKSPSGMTWW